jgi:hypothetical protein
VQSFCANAGHGKQFLGQDYFLFSLDITFQVMAVTEMSPGHQDAVTPLLEGLDDECRVDPAGAHDPYGPQVGWILQPRNTGQVSTGICAPVAQERYDFRLKITHIVILCLVDEFVKNRIHPFYVLSFMCQAYK